MTENSFSGSYDLVAEPATESIFVIEDLDDNFVSTCESQVVTGMITSPAIMYCSQFKFCI